MKSEKASAPCRDDAAGAEERRIDPGVDLDQADAAPALAVALEGIAQGDGSGSGIARPIAADACRSKYEG